MSYKNDDWEKVGTCGVDAGLIWIGDPCYVVAQDSTHVFKSWDKFCKQHDKLNKKGVAVFDVTGIALQTADGDGEYPVYVKRDSNGSIIEAKIMFRGKED